jgi:hypothetical protein
MSKLFHTLKSCMKKKKNSSIIIYFIKKMFGYINIDHQLFCNTGAVSLIAILSDVLHDNHINKFHKLFKTLKNLKFNKVF